ncbi:MAG: OmpA family protein [Planctomycetota bacterium]
MIAKLSRTTLLILLAGTLMPLTGCRAKLQAQLRDREETIRSLDGQLAKLRMDKEQAERERDAALAQVRDIEKGAAEASAKKPGKSAIDELMNEMSEENRGKVNVSYRHGHLSIGVPNSVSFAPGSTKISSEGRNVLDEVARVLNKRFPGQRIWIEGHTDTTPIQKTKDKYLNNRHLSAMRAEAVAEHLTGKGVAESKIVIVGYGQHDPVSPSNLSANRRVEIVIGD